MKDQIIADISRLCKNVIREEGYLMIITDVHQVNNSGICLVYDMRNIPSIIVKYHPIHFIILGKSTTLKEWGIPEERITSFNYPIFRSKKELVNSDENLSGNGIGFILGDCEEDPELLVCASVIRAMNCILQQRCVVVAPENLIPELQFLANDHIIFNSLASEKPLFEECSLLIASGSTAAKGLAYGKPVIVAGKNGFGGLVTIDNMTLFIANNFAGRPGGKQGEQILPTSLIREINFFLEIQETDELTYLTRLASDNMRQLMIYSWDLILEAIGGTIEKIHALIMKVSKDSLMLVLHPKLSSCIKVDEYNTANGVSYGLRNSYTNKVLAALGEVELSLIRKCTGEIDVMSVLENICEATDIADGLQFIRELWGLGVLTFADPRVSNLSQNPASNAVF